MKRWWGLSLIFWPWWSFAANCEPVGLYEIDESASTVVYISNLETASENFDRSIAWVSAPTFQVLERDGCPTDYGFDVNRVYYQGQVIEGVDPDNFFEADNLTSVWRAGEDWVNQGRIISDSFQDLGGGYFQIGASSFYQNQTLPYPLKAVKNDFGISDEKIFYKGQPTDFDPNTFKAFQHYALDAYKMHYYVGDDVTIIEGADAASFVEFKDQKLLAADDRRFYFEGHVIESPASEIEYFSHGFFRDENQVFFYETPLPQFDADTFKVHLKAGKYLQDKNGAYYVTRLAFRLAEVEVEPLAVPVDYESFGVVRYNIAYDKNNVFETSNVANFTLESLGIKKPETYESVPSITFEKPASMTQKVARIPLINSGSKTSDQLNYETDDSAQSVQDNRRLDTKPVLKSIETDLAWWQQILSWLKIIL